MVATGAREVCSGEVCQTFARGKADLTLTDYRRHIRLKTAELFVAACRAGAHLSGKPHGDPAHQAAADFGLHLGIAYQMYDDLADILLSSDSAGKTLGTDASSGKLTLPLILERDASGTAVLERLRKGEDPRTVVAPAQWHASFEALAAEAVPGAVAEVTLYEDRATVTRTFEVRAGRQRVVLGPLSPLVSERHLSLPAGAWSVEDARVVREEVPRRLADPEAHRAAAEALDAAEQRSPAADRAADRAREAVSRAEAALEAALEATPRALVEEGDPSRWVGAVVALTERRTVAALRVVEAEAVAALAVEERDRRRADLEALRAGAPVWRAWLVLQGVAAAATRAEVRYPIPCAVWRPSHAAAVDTAASRLSWGLRAVCWNATGEDWRGVVLTCSTARPWSARMASSRRRMALRATGLRCSKASSSSSVQMRWQPMLRGPL
jgi:geranylgeranyl pyrophosphate synthase